MNSSAVIPIDQFGHPVPVGNLKTRGTQAITLTSNAVVYASNAFSSKTRTMASAVLQADGDAYITLTSRDESSESERVSVIVNEAGASLAVAVVGGNAIQITPKADSTCKEVVEAIAANPKANDLVSAVASNDEAVIDASQAKQYLDGWDAGNIGVYVRMWGTQDFFYGKYSEAETKPKTASCPVTAGVEVWEFVEPGDKISLKSVTNGAIVYITPAKQM